MAVREYAHDAAWNVDRGGQVGPELFVDASPAWRNKI